MEAGTLVVVQGQRPQHLVALAKAQARKIEIGQFKRDIAAGRISAAEALADRRACGAVTIGTILLAQPNWGRVKTSRFIQRLGAPATVWGKPVESLTERQRAVIVRGLINPDARVGPLDMW